MRAAAAITTTITLMLATAGSAGAAERYTVAPHDTLYRIARHFGVSIAALAEANGLGDPSRIRAGTVLLIPATLIPVSRTVARVPAAAPRQAAPVSRSVGAASFAARPMGTTYTAGTTYTVHPGDTLYSLARTRGLTVAVLQEANHLASADRLQAGQVLQIPPARAAERPSPAVEHPVPEHPSRTSVSAPAPLHPTKERSALLARRVTAAALHYLGTPFVWGGTSPAGVDCSGLVYLVYAPYVPHLPRLSYDQWTIGTAVDRSDLVSGDLVFFDTGGTGASHVGIYIGDGEFVHPAASAHRVVIDRLDGPYYASHYLGARRVL